MKNQENTIICDDFDDFCDLIAAVGTDLFVVSGNVPTAKRGIFENTCLSFELEGAAENYGENASAILSWIERREALIRECLPQKCGRFSRRVAHAFQKIAACKDWVKLYPDTESIPP